MKRYICILSIMLLIFSLCGCTKTRQNGTVVFYYQSESEMGTIPSATIVAEQRQYTDEHKNYLMIMQRYFDGPLDSKMQSPYPEGTTITRIAINKGRAYVTLTNHLSALYGVELNIACACLTRTIEELTGVDSIELSLESGMISNEPYLILRYSDFAVSDGFADYITNQS